MVPSAFNALFLCSWFESLCLKTWKRREMMELSGMKRTVFHTKQSAGSVMENLELKLVLDENYDSSDKHFDYQLLCD